MLDFTAANIGRRQGMIRAECSCWLRSLAVGYSTPRHSPALENLDRRGGLRPAASISATDVESTAGRGEIRPSESFNAIVGTSCHTSR